MSELIYSQEHILEQQKYPSCKKISQQTKILVQLISSKFPQITIVSSNSNSIRLYLRIYQSKIQSELNIFILINLSTQLFEVFAFYDQNNIPIAIKDSLPLGIFKRFLTKAAINSNQQSKITIDSYNGLLQYRFMALFSYDLLISGRVLQRLFKMILSSLRLNQSLLRKKIYEPYNLIPLIYQEKSISMANDKKNSINVFANYEDAKFQIISKYVSLSSSAIDGLKIGSNKYINFKQNTLKQQNPSQIQTRHLFCFDIRKQLNKVEPVNYTVMEQDQRRLNKSLEVNILSPLVPGDNKYIFNYVKVLQPEKVNPRPYKVGGFSIIMLSYLNFQYLKSWLVMRDSVNDKLVRGINALTNETEEQQPQATLRFLKWICIKLPRNQVQFNKQFSHEIKIVQLLRTSYSPYMLKYYKSNQLNFKYNDWLMMDACNLPSLSQFLEKNSLTLSIQNKLQILLHIIKSVVFLETKKIAHMDLKPANILISPQKNLIKLIDFGEAYNQTICGSQYFPGVSFPYVSPEALTPLNRIFSSKSDVFSFGIIMHQILFQKRPFEYMSNLKDIYKAKKYLEKINIIHQNLETRFSHRVLNILQLLIVKCLDSDESKRPYPSWIALILFMCLANMKQNW